MLSAAHSRPYHVVVCGQWRALPLSVRQASDLIIQNIFPLASQAGRCVRSVRLYTRCITAAALSAVDEVHSKHQKKWHGPGGQIMLILLDVNNAEFVGGPLEQQGEQHAHVSCPRFQISPIPGKRAYGQSRTPPSRERAYELLHSIPIDCSTLSNSSASSRPPPSLLYYRPSQKSVGLCIIAWYDYIECMHYVHIQRLGNK